ncbi:hypothetical protein FSP39_016464 [Pinctada imbricata]|uniref:Uncharacterized protein n=1 Tax=Pinctada imbricata TaxID=66713 RepID=A0AA89BW04_PINIB|nr:hypothetical protein FSP39_016464 [Pinctada imbricata]
MVNLLQTYGRLQAHTAPQGAGVYILAQSTLYSNQLTNENIGKVIYLPITDKITKRVEITSKMALDSRIGQAFKGEITIMGNRVSGIPDVRFPCFSRNHGTVQIVTVAESNNVAHVNEDGMFTINHLSDAVMGRHGMELLIERKNSAFESAVTGIICFGSKASGKQLLQTCRKFAASLRQLFAASLPQAQNSYAN